VPWPADAPFEAALDAVMADRLVRYRIPGAVIGLVEPGGRVVKPYGEAATETHVPMTSGTVFQLASISKSVAAWAVLRLVESGSLDLDAPVRPLLMRWRWPSTSFDDSGVTVRRLLSHTAGFSLHGYPGLPPETPLPTLEASLEGDNGGSGPVRLIQQPGAGFLYSGGGYSILQLLVEETTGEAFASFAEREVLRPLGMLRSSYDWRADLQGATAGAYGSNGQRLPNYLFAEQAAAGLYSTGGDLAAFVAASMPGPSGEPPGRGVLSGEVVTLSRTAAPATAGGYGLGVEIWPLAADEAAVGHGGANRGWRARWVALPRRLRGLLVLTNGENGERLTDELTCEWTRRTARAAPRGCR
jgi:CubicO group peptidase (beta-lactamase class C family)